MSPKEKDNTERVNVFFSEDILSKLREEAKKKGMTVSGLVRMITMMYLADEKE